MDGMIFRNDDINPSTKWHETNKIYKFIKETFPEVQIWSCVTLLGRDNEKGSVYPETPFKYNPTEWFYKVNSFTEKIQDNFGVITASHGLLHFDHSVCSYEQQEMSIVTSCNYLNTKIFVPPFNRYNDDTIAICLKNNITLIKPEEGWCNLKYVMFEPSVKLWYFHSWEYTLESFKERLGIYRLVGNS